ncbi:stage III sporulation protein AF [Paenibacillus cremeus]|uniref:Stage III sporulation protein AF n=1 Tax=Paenibacillus cremeus TaxID=2163881 RepID=A0A559KHA8_9BACL|nr:stage III sporulation protein AF [Paenibacillus cremeus]TVY11496.1 stage III sporulation protein AF [Paenibacillus cremeus]
MEWLSGWLKSVILVILLATFVDLLLPNQSMQRYVKTVMSLFLLLTLLHPLLTLFEKHTNMEKLLADALFQPGSQQSGAGSDDAMASLPTIQQRADAIRSYQQKETHQLVQNQAADLMKRKIESTGVTVQSIQVETATDASGQAIIKQVTVSVDPKAQPPTSKGSAAPKAGMEPVKPVSGVTVPDIQIGSRTTPAVPAARMKDNTGAALTPELEQKKTQIMYMLEQDWELKPDQIALSIQQGR